MRFFKRLPLSVLTVMISITVKAQFYDFEVDGIYYEHSWDRDGEVFVTTGGFYYEGPGYPWSDAYREKVVIPENVVYDGKTYNVTGIREQAFSYCHNLDSVIIPESVTVIEGWSFMDCWQLKYVGLPSSITEIRDHTFMNCYELTEIELPKGVVKIGYGAFEGCGLTKIKLYDVLKEIDAYAFSGCSSLTEIIIPESVESIGSRAFSGCSELKSVSLPQSLKKISDGLFYGCSMLSEVSIPASVEDIGEYAFYGCRGLTFLEMRDGVNRIGIQAFRNCTALKEIAIPETVESIADNAFEGCYGLEIISVDVSNRYYDSREDCNAIIETATNRLVQGCNNTQIPHNITSISDYAFEGCTDIISLFIPKSLTTLNSSTFKGCRNIQSIVVEEGNPVYDSRGDCNAVVNSHNGKLILACVNSVIPEGVDTIGRGAFMELPITSVVLPEGVKCIEYDAFYKCEALSSVTFPSTLTTIGISAFSWCRNLKSVSFPGNLTEIGTYAFSNAGLETLEIPQSVTKIGESAFDDCEIVSVVIPDNVMEIGASVFMNCDKLRTAVLPENMKWIPFNMFAYSGLESINIPDSVEEIRDDAFRGCNLKEVVIPEKVKIIGANAFRDNYDLYIDKLSLPEGLEGVNSNAFNSCHIDTIVLPSSVRWLQSGAFSGCDAKYISIPPTVELQWDPWMWDPDYGAFPFDGNYEAEIHVRGHKTDATFLSDYNIVYSYGDRFVYDWDVEYRLVFMVDGKEFAVFDITPYKELSQYIENIGVPVKDGCAFLKWDTLPELMPESDVVVNAVFTDIKYCAIPTVSYVNGQLRLDCETTGATIVTEITAPDVAVYEENSIQLTKTYMIKAFAKANGYANSDTLKALLGWIDVEVPENSDGIMQIKTVPVLIYLNGRDIVVNCPFEGQEIEVYSVDGRLLAQSRIVDGSAIFKFDSVPTDTIIIKAGEKTVKLLLKP